MTVYRKHDILKGLTETTQEAFKTLKEKTNTREKWIEPKPRLIPCEGQKKIDASTNAFILFGPDRAGSCGSGYGGRGDTHASSMRICVGHMGARAASINVEGDPLAGHPSNTYDAATIYMSQKTDIDKDFMLVKGKSVPIADARSAIALKADGIRIIAREGIKLITGVDLKNSQDTDIVTEGYGIDLIANNDSSDMQPLVKGYNLINALNALVEHIHDLGGVVDAFITSQIILNTFLQMHIHVSALAGPTTMDPLLLQIGVPAVNLDLALRCKTGVFFQKINLELYRASYLFGVDRNQYILSYHNNTN